MANLTIAFEATTTGDHYVGYKEVEMDADYGGDYAGVITVNVATPGIQYVDIPIKGSLYCGDIHMEGYVVAECHVIGAIGTTLPNVVPPASTNRIDWTKTLEAQNDPCTNVNLSCDNVSINTITIADGGKGYIPGTALTVFIGDSDSGSTAGAIASLGDGIVTAITEDNLGAGYTNGSYTGVSLVKSGGGTEGTGITVDVDIVGGAIDPGTLVLVTGGSGYTNADNSLLGAYMTLDGIGFTPGTEAQIGLICDGGFADEVHSITLTSEGEGYTSVPGVLISPVLSPGPTTTNATFNVTLDNCPIINLEDYHCGVVTNLLGQTPTYELALGESVNMCANELKLNNLPSEFKVEEVKPCKCLGCEVLIVDPSAATGSTIKITYTKCWDRDNGEELVTTVLNAGDAAVQFDCMIPETLTIEDNTAGTTISFIDCTGA